MRNNKALKEQAEQYLARLLNDKATIEWKIDKDQKFIARMHHDLGTHQFLYYKESIENYQSELKQVINQIEKTKQKIKNYEKIGC
jgi:hypothetical protein